MNTDGSLLTEAALISKRARELGLTQATIAAALNASQSQVSRILSGTSKRRSKLFDAVSEFVLSARRPGISEAITLTNELNNALASVWDGTPEHAHALALVIRSLGTLCPSRTARDPVTGIPTS